MKTLLSAIFLSILLAGCGPTTYHAEVEMFPGQEAVMVGMCENNDGLVRGWMKEANSYSVSRLPSVVTYRTIYYVECKNGAEISKTLERPAK